VHFTKNFIASAIAIISLFTISGCQSAMTTNTATTHENPPSDQDISRPFTFKGHNFGAHCFDTVGCKIFYAGRYVVMDEENEVRASPKNPDYFTDLSASHLDIPNFPVPATVTWKSKDGSQLKAEVDMAEIFKDQVIRHNVAKEDLPTETIATLDEPEIILVVNDRTISVYMRAAIFMKDTSVRKREIRDETILAFKRTY
jgi:hypothetical protein